MKIRSNAFGFENLRSVLSAPSGHWLLNVSCFTRSCVLRSLFCVVIQNVVAASGATTRRTRSMPTPVCVNQCRTAPSTTAITATASSLTVRSPATVTKAGRRPTAT